MLKFPDCPSDIKVISVEINLKKHERLIVAIYTPPSQCKHYFISELAKSIR